MSKFVVSARKYRPQRFSEVVGQKHVADTLTNALKTDQLAHAFLFCGPRGVGKTTCARILAKVLNCSDLQNGIDPCNACSSCQSFNDNASFNILELDAASNNSVEHIRTLIEQVRFQPQQGSYKVFIIDEVHMLSQQAFNAFLKTLEEPPPYAIFILATTEKHKILPTILSRCQIFDFKRIQVEEIMNQLADICSKEGLKYEQEALHLIGQKADGAMRDALSIFDKISSASNGDITYKSVIENLNILDFEYFFKLTNAALTEDINSIMLCFDDIIRNGFDPEQCLQGLAQHLRELMVCKNKETLILLQSNDALKERYLNQAQSANLSFLLNGLNILNESDIHFPRVKNKRLHAEIALSKICFLNRVVQNTEKKTEDLSPSPATQPAPTPDHKKTPLETQVKPSPEVGPENRMPTQDNPTTAPEEPKTTTKPRHILNTSLSALRAQVIKEEKEKSSKKRELNKMTLLDAWKEYANQVESKSTRTALLDIELELADKAIKVFVPTNVVRDIIIQEQDLNKSLRNTFQLEGYDIDITVDFERFPDRKKFETKKVLTNREKYQNMVAVNPSLHKLTERLGLSVDTE